jgi:hypothetical protein
MIYPFAGRNRRENKQCSKLNERSRRTMEITQPITICI